MKSSRLAWAVVWGSGIFGIYRFAPPAIGADTGAAVEARTPTGPVATGRVDAGDVAVTAPDGSSISAEEAFRRGERLIWFGPKQSGSEAIKWFRLAAEAGLAEAQFRLAECYGLVDNNNDPTEEAKWFRKAADQGDNEAMRRLAVCYNLGSGVQKDGAEAIKWFRRAVDGGNTIAISQLGDMFAEGDGVPRDYVEAANWYRKSVEQGEWLGKFQLGMLYEYGLGVAQSHEQALTWIRSAAEHDSRAKDFLARDSMSAGEAATHGWSWANGFELPLGMGDFVYAEAAKCYRRAADQGDADAQFYLGVAYSKGRGLPRDDVQSLQWFRRAAELGNPDAQFNVALYYGKGVGTPIDNPEAVRWLRKAAEQGIINAQFMLGECFSNGEMGVPQDLAEALKWYRRAAAQGDPQSQFSVGELYRLGRGVSQDYVEAYAYFSLAAAGGDEQARTSRDSLMLILAKNQVLIAAQQRSKELKAELDAEKTKAANLSHKESGSSGGSPAASAEAAPFEAKCMGSGFVVGADGLVVTNWHVVEKAARLELITAWGRMSAKIVAADQSNDLVILRAAEPLAAVLPIRSSRGAKIGTEVFTIGFPNPDMQGFSPKFNRGEISSVAGAADDPRYFQISVPVQPGNSGGALCDAEGRVIGVVAAKLDERLAFKTSGSLPENVNYAIKSTYLLALLESLELPQNALAADDKGPVSPEVARQRAQNSAVLVLVY